MRSTIFDLRNLIKLKIYKQRHTLSHRVVFQILRILIFIFIKLKKLNSAILFCPIKNLILKESHQLGLIDNFVIIILIFMTKMLYSS